MKVSHEVPKVLFQESTKFNDYPYVLSHLIKEDAGYAAFYKAELKRADFSILDNSAFELGASVSHDDLMNSARELRPTHIVLPDTLHNCRKTLRDSLSFYHTHANELVDLKITPIGVLQGDSFEELRDCLMMYYYNKVTFIAIPFHCIKDGDQGVVRFQFLRYLIQKDGFEALRKLKIHLLGIKNPQELSLYSEEEKSLIHSIDTSSPILHGIVGNGFTQWGCQAAKPRLKLADNLDIQIDSVQHTLIMDNVKQFKELAQ